MLFSTLNVFLFAAQGALLLSELTAVSNAFPTTLRQRNMKALEFELKRSTSARIGKRQAQGSSAIPLGHAPANLLYTMPITLGGVELEVAADLGSTDLVVAANIEQATNTEVPISVAFAVGNGSGTINEATLTVGDFRIGKQAYVSLSSAEDLPFSSGVSGVFGLGPRFASQVLFLLNDSSIGEPAVDQILSSGSSGVGNFITMTLSRSLDLADFDLTSGGGFLTIGSLITAYQDVTKQPQIPMFLTQADGVGVQTHWEVLMDANGIIGPDGQPIETTTLFDDGPKNQLKTIFDSGFALPPVPENVAAAIYGRVPGSMLNQTFNYWMVPCAYELNISFVFGGVKYPIHPLDLTLPIDPNEDVLANDMCMGTFMPSSAAAFQSLGELDIILGMPFLRNTYFLGNFGNFTSTEINSGEIPSVQLLSTTNMATAHQEFVQVRLGGKDTTGSQAALLPASTNSSAIGTSSAANSNPTDSGTHKDGLLPSGSRESRKRSEPLVLIAIALSAVAVLVL